MDMRKTPASPPRPRLALRADDSYWLFVGPESLAIALGKAISSGADLRSMTARCVDAADAGRTISVLLAGSQIAEALSQSGWERHKAPGAPGSWAWSCPTPEAMERAGENLFAACKAQRPFALYERRSLSDALDAAPNAAAPRSGSGSGRL